MTNERRRYEVVVPVCGYEKWIVEASDEDEAFNKAAKFKGECVARSMRHDANAEAEIRLIEG